MVDIKVPIASPIIGDEEIEEVVKVLKSGMIAQGPKVEEFEKNFADWIGSDYAIATNSGTSALHIANLSCGIGDGDEVITTPFTFIATANSILYTGAKPIFADIDSKTFNIDSSKIEELINDKTKAIMPVHLYGLPANMDEIRKIAEENDLFIIEDAAQAHGAMMNNEKVGNLGDLACFSFYPTKNMTTSEGGMITTNDEDLADKAKIFRAHGASVRYLHEDIGYNFRMTDIEAAIGICQLEKIDEFNLKRIENANYLNEALKDLENIITPSLPENYKHVYHQYTIIVKKGNRDDWVKFLNKKGIGTGIYYPIPLYNQPIYKKLGLKGNCPVADEISESVISLPVNPSLSSEDLDLVIKSLIEANENFS